MTKRTNNHVNEQFGNLENLDKINNTDTNLPKNYKTISDLLANFSNHEGINNEENIANFLNEGNFKLSDLQDIELDINFLKKLDCNNIKLYPEIQITIAKLFLNKLKEKIKNIPNNEKKEYLQEQFEFDFKEKNKKNPLKPIIQNLDNYTDLIKDIKITNKEIFDTGNISEQMIQFNKTSPSTQNKITNLIVFEMKDALENYAKSKEDLLNNTDKLFLTGKSNLKNIFIGNDKIILQLQNKKNQLEENQDIDEISKIDKEIRKANIDYLRQQGESNKLVPILENLLQNNFDFMQLNDKEKQTLIDLSIDKKIDKKNRLAKQLEKKANFDLNEYNEFINNIYNFSEKESKQVIKRGNKNINLKITKDFEKGEHNQFNNFEEFKNMDYLPLSYTVNLDDNDENIVKEIENPLNSIFSVFKNNNGIITSYTTKNGNIMVGNGYILEIGGKKLTTKIIDHLLNCNDSNLENELKRFGLYEVLQETYKKAKQSNNNGNLFEQILANTDVKIIKRNLILKGKDIDKLSQLYLLPYINGNRDIQNIIKENDCEDAFDWIEGANREGTEGSDKGEEYAEKIFEKIFNDYPSDEDTDIDEYTIDKDIENNARDFYKNLNKNGKKAFEKKLKDLCNDKKLDESIITNLIDELKNPINITVNSKDKEFSNKELGKENEAKNDLEKFNKKRDTINGPKDCKFEKGTKLYFKKYNSELPPHECTDSYYKFEIGDIIGDIGSGTFEIKAYGNELGLKSVKTYTLPYTLEQLTKMVDNNEIFKVKSGDENNRNACIEKIKNSKAISKFSTFGNMNGQIQLKGDKFVKLDDKGKNIDIKYLDCEIESTGKKNSEGGTNLVKYEIKGINTTKGTVKVSTNFDGWNKEDPTEKVKYEYERELPFEQFILLIESKKLKGYSADEEKEREAIYKEDEEDRLPHRGLFQRVSFGNFKNIFKGKTKEIKDAFKAQSAENEEQLENWMFSREGLNLYEHIGNIMSFGGLRGNMKAAFDGAELDYYNNRDNKIWKKIDYRYKRYADDPMFSAGFKKNILGVLTPGYKGEGVKRYQAAGAFLAMLKKEGPYPRAFQDKEGTGYRVEMFLGPDHKEKFMQAYQKKQNEVNETRERALSGGEKMQSMVDLQKLELQYIIDTIDDSGENGPGPAGNARKTIWSNKFKDELDTNMKNRIDGFNKPSEAKNYNQAKENFINNLGNNKQHKAIPELIKMCEKAGRPEQIHEVKGYLLMVLMSGIARPSKDAEEKLRKTARSIGFLPGYRGKDTNVGEKIEILLNGISKNDPSIKDFNKNEIFSGNFKEKNSKFMAYRGTIDNGNGTKILKYIENPRYEGDNSIKSKSQAKEESTYKNICQELIKKFEDNGDLGNLSGDVKNIAGYIKAAPLTATYNTIKKYIPDKGKYTVEDEQIGDAKDIWNAISNSLGNANNDLDFYMTIFKNILSNDIDMNSFCKSIPLIKNLKKGGRLKEAKYIRWHIFKGKIYDRKSGTFPPEFESCLNRFYEFFFNNIENINEGIIKNKFGNDFVRDYQNSYSKINWKIWNAFDDKQKSRVFQNYKEYEYYRGYTINEEIQKIRKNLKNKGIDCIPEPDEVKDDSPSILNPNVDTNDYRF